MITLNIQNESSSLEAVVLGISNSFGGVPEYEKCYDPKSKQHVRAGTFPLEEALVFEIEAFCRILERYSVHVYRPNEIKDLNQIFVRDIAFVIDKKIVLPNIIQDRAPELEAIQYLLDQLSDKDIIKMPKNARAEGGDVIPWNEYLFIGYSKDPDFKKYKVARTNKEGVSFLEETFQDRIMRSFELNKSDENPKENALHLDCCFQPIGENQAILFEGGFKNRKDIEFLIDYFGDNNIIRINRDEMYEMHSNIFSISPEVIVSEKKFTRLNSILRNKGFIVEEVPYSEISKMEGLLRCSTMPLIRK